MIEVYVWTSFITFALSIFWLLGQLEYSKPKEYLSLIDMFFIVLTIYSALWVVAVFWVIAAFLILAGLAEKISQIKVYKFKGDDQ